MRASLSVVFASFLALLAGCGDDDSTTTQGEVSDGGQSQCFPDQFSCGSDCCDINQTCEADVCVDDPTGGVVDCSIHDPLTECSDVTGCKSISGSMATQQEPGVYDCPDDVSPFACVEADCEPYAGIICEIGMAEVGRWMVEGCIPPGWEPCPDDAMCG